jgi:hypothetical protein
VKQVIYFVVLVLLLTACGHKESPTGGKRDTENPQILAITPAEFSDISKFEKIEVVFSKPIERSSLKTGLYIYPPILEKYLKWDGAILNIEWQEDLPDSSNYFFTFNTNIKGEHDNLLDKNYIFVFRNGKIQESTISGNISYEKVEDKGKEITLSVSTADSVKIFNKKLTNSSFRLENLNRAPHILQAYIDKNNNHSFNPNSEPYDFRFVPRQKITNVNLELTYQDTTKPKVNSVQVMAQNKLQIKLSEPAAEFDQINIFTADSLQTPMPVITASLEEDNIFVLTSQMDTLKYTLELSNLEDLKKNIKRKQSWDFSGVTKPDTLAPKLIDFWPLDGSSINEQLPKIHYKFDEIILPGKIEAELTEVETGRNIPIKISGANSRILYFQPQEPLYNYSSYNFSLEVADANDNKQKLEQITFILLVR